MNARRSFGSDQPPPLSHLFEPPDGYLGTFGWLCGYSADGHFLNDATERFTRRTRRRRALEGDVALGMILDPGAPRVSIVDVPGVLHLPLRPGEFRLMHAKVALLGFRAMGREGWRIRLVVSTGNWTRETLEESLDLACRLEVGSDDHEPTEAGQRLVDVAAGADLIEALRAQVDEAPLRAASVVTREALQALDDWRSIIATRMPNDVRPRFVDSRRLALLPQIVERVSEEPRNYLAMGSGFYERGGAGLPSVPAAVLAALGGRGALTPEPEVDLFVNPEGCQSVAGAMPAIADAGWSVRRPGRGPFPTPRGLHAKFLFGAQYDGRSPRCLRPWLYLGSGNLTAPGLLRAGHEGGNVEAGVVLAPERLLWEAGAGGTSVQVALPLAWDRASLLAERDVSPGGEMPGRTDGYLVAPVSHLVWAQVSDGMGRLTPPEGTETDFAVLDPSGTACARDGGAALWLGPCPPEVDVTWDEDGSTRRERVPVIDGRGRVGATPASAILLDEVWSLLADFPLPPGDDEDETGGDEAAGNGSGGRGSAAASSGYAIRQVMGLIERIAARQVDLHPSDWTTWCVRLGQTLEQVRDDPDLLEFRELRLDPLSALLAEPFRPDFARDASSEEGRLYEDTIARVGAAWRVNGLEPIGA